MSKFSDLIASLSIVRDERAAVEKKLEAAKRELAEINTAPLCKTDVIAQLDAYIEGCKKMFDENLQHVLKLHNVAGRESFGDIGGGLPLLRTFAGTFDDRLQVAVMAPQLKSTIRESLKDWKCPGSAPLIQRKARRSELEKEVASLTAQRKEIEAAADAARNQL